MTADCCAPEGNLYDLVILGSGSMAFAAALAAQEMGKTAVMTEERTIGGTCVNRGCLPSKNLIEAAKLVFDARNPRYPGLETCGSGLKVDFRALIAQKDEVIRVYREKKYDSLVGGQVALEAGKVRFLDARTVEVGSKQLTGERFLIATGSRPTIPEIPGLVDVPYLTSDLLTHGEEAELKTLPASLLIVGGGYVALELGQMFARFGSEVTVLDRNPQLLAHGYEPQRRSILFERKEPELSPMFAWARAGACSERSVCSSRPAAGPTPTGSVLRQPALPSLHMARSKSMRAYEPACRIFSRPATSSDGYTKARWRLPSAPGRARLPRTTRSTAMTCGPLTAGSFRAPFSPTRRSASSASPKRR